MPKAPKVQKRMGRPPKDPAKRASDTFHFRVQPEHGELIRQAADRSGLDVSGWIRDRTLKAARRETG
jgi:predicted HicB family RNase H-like nuclease